MGLGVAIGGGLISAVLLWFAFPPIAAFPVAFVAYTPLLNRAPDLEGRQRFFVGWVHGICVQAALFYWLPEGLMQARGADTWAAFRVFGVLVAYQGLFSAVYLFLLGFLGWRKSPVFFALGAAGLFASLEALFPFIFPVPLGGVLYVVPALVQVAEVGGVAVLSFVLVFSCALLARSLAPHGTGKIADLRGWVMAVAVIIIGLAGYGTWRTSEILSKHERVGAPTASPLRALGVVQPNLPVDLDLQNNISSRAASLDLTLGVESEIEGSADLILWPEGAFPFFFMPEERRDIPRGRSSYSHRYTRKILKHVRAHNRPMIMGALVDGGHGAARNGVFVVEPNGRTQEYAKKWPLPWIEGGRLLAHMTGTTLAPLVAGHGGSEARPTSFDVAGIRVLPSLYQEMSYGLEMERRVVATDPGLLLNLSDDRWFGATSASELQLMNLVLRAVELRVPVVRVAYGGVSAVIGASGHIEKRTGLLTRAAERWPVRVGAGARVFPRFFRLSIVAMAFMAWVLAAYYGVRSRKQRGKARKIEG